MHQRSKRRRIAAVLRGLRYGVTTPYPRIAVFGPSAQVDRVRDDPGAVAAVALESGLHTVDAGLVNVAHERGSVAGRDLLAVAQQAQPGRTGQHRVERVAVGRSLRAER